MHGQPMPHNELIGSAEAATILGKSPRTVHRMVSAGALVPAMTAPGGFVGTYLFTRADVEAARDAATQAAS